MDRLFNFLIYLIFAVIPVYSGHTLKSQPVSAPKINSPEEIPLNRHVANGNLTKTDKKISVVLRFRYIYRNVIHREMIVSQYSGELDDLPTFVQNLRFSTHISI